MLANQRHKSLIFLQRSVHVFYAVGQPDFVRLLDTALGVLWLSRTTGGASDVCRGPDVRSGGGGIRIPGTLCGAHPLSRRAPLATRSPLLMGFGGTNIRENIEVPRLVV